MPIGVDRNGNYGPPLVTQKYQPLAGIDFQVADAPIYAAMLSHRDRLLRSIGIWPKPLDLLAPDWGTLVTDEAAHDPPIVVISSNRSKWIKAGFDAAVARLGPPLNLATFASECDLRALSGNQPTSPPFYTPVRLGAAPNRNVYIVVHALEYRKYRRELATYPEVTIVGWRFAKANKTQLTGFGASRYAAIEFCKYLRAQAALAGPAPWDYAWLLDDNVVALRGFPGFAAIENAMPAAQVAAGFRGGTDAQSRGVVRQFALDEIAAGRTGNPPPGLPGHLAAGLIQQAALWNIAYLTAHDLNFGRVFLASGEDVGLTNYFTRSAIPYFWFGGIGVLKELPTHDDTPDSGQLKAFKSGLTKLFADSEAANPPVAAPPLPLMVQPAQAADGGPQILGKFVVERALPNSLMHAQAGNAEVQNAARCQAVEQMVCGAIGRPAINGAAMDRALVTTFSTLAPNDPVIVQVTAP